MNVQAVSRHHDCGLQRLHSVSDVAINWLEGMKVLAK